MPGPDRKDKQADTEASELFLAPNKEAFAPLGEIFSQNDTAQKHQIEVNRMYNL